MPSLFGRLTWRTWGRRLSDQWFADWMDFWGDLAWYLDPRRPAIERSQAHDHHDAYLIAAGNAGDSPGTGGQD